MRPEEWLDELATRLEELSGDAVGPAVLTAEERGLLLDLARIAAHTSERWAAPLSTYLAGSALAGLAAGERVDRLRALVTDMGEADTDGGDGADG